MICQACIFGWPTEDSASDRLVLRSLPFSPPVPLEQHSCVRAHLHRNTCRGYAEEVHRLHAPIFTIATLMPLRRLLVRRPTESLKLPHFALSILFYLSGTNLTEKIIRS
ncbi:unnamed protein product [Protopolystoma xenopodis]|uniref:Uncharacterized protein n=1 Tax=Protopolystoma xenopodis TaxID=117903 RepID=A0A448X437_9PLAT|nr:unnamed protein product [Protopolystoma xenopodis]